MSRTRKRHKRRWWLRAVISVAKVIESRRARARERQAMHRGEDMPKAGRHADRWDIWSWD